MSRSFDGVDDYLEFSGTLGNVFTATAWIQSGANRVYQDGVSASGNDFNEISIAVTTGIVEARTRSTAQSQAVSAAGFTDSNWHHVAAVFASATDRRAFLDGGNKGTNATSRTPTGQNLIRVGNRCDGGGDYTGLIAHMAVWNVALNDNEIEMLGAQRISPRFVRPASLALYLPYLGRDSPEIDVIGGRAFTVNGTTASDAEPPLLWLPGRRRIFISAAAAGGQTYTQTKTDTIDAVDGYLDWIARLRQQGEDVSFSDSGVQYAQRRRTSEEPIELADSFIFWRQYRRTLGDDLTLLDGFIKSVLGSGTTYVKIMSDAFEFVDDAGQRWTHRFTQATDALTSADGLLYWARRVREFSDDVTYFDGEVVIRRYLRVPDDGLGLLDELLRTYFPAVLYDVRIRIGAAAGPRLGEGLDVPILGSQGYGTVLGGY